MLMIYFKKWRENMIKIDMRYGDNRKKIDKIDVAFYPNDGEYRGNIYKDNKIVGDYVCNDSVELEKSFPQLTFDWN